MSAKPEAPPYTASFRDVLEHELEQVRARRVGVLRTAVDAPVHGPDDDQPGKERRDAQRLDLFGLAMSGGGIRSGTFNLGILQALARLDLLKRVDYISSVSGGGYIHAWLAAWVRREVTWGDVRERRDVTPVENVSRQMAPDRVVQANARRDGVPPGTVRDDEPAPVHHLREYSRYLAPRAGLLSLDSWALVGLYLRNLLANGLMFVAAGVVLSLACRLLVMAFTAGRLPQPAEWGPFARFAETSVLFRKLADWRPLGWTREDGLAWVAFGLAVGLLVVAQVMYRWFVAGVRAGGRHLAAGTPAAPTQATADREWQRILFRVAYPCLAASVVGLWLVGPSGEGSRLPRGLRLNKEGAATSNADLGWVGGVLELLDLKADIVSPYAWCALGFGVVGVLMAVLGLVLEWLRLRGTVNVAAPDSAKRWFLILIGGGVFGAVFGVCLTAIVENLGFEAGFGAAHPCLLATAGPALLMAALTVCGYLEAIICGRHLSEQEREWRARVGAMTLTVGLVWAAVFAVVLYLPWAVGLFRDEVGWAAAAGWAVSGAATYLLRPKAADKPTGAAGSRLVRLGLKVAPVVFLAGAVALMSDLAHQLRGVSQVLWSDHPVAAGHMGVAGAAVVVAVAHPAIPFDHTDFIAEAEAGTWPAAVFWLVGIGVGGMLYAYLIDPNLFSLHSVYGNRLIRCYLAASRKKPGWKTPPHERPPEQPSPGVPTGVNDADRVGDVFTGFGHRDDFSLLWLQPDTDAFPPQLPPGVEEPWRVGRTPYLGPYPLFNTTLNLVGGADLATQDRKGESFVLSPGYCGGECTGWARFRVPADKPHLARNLTVGRAMTISGAAVDPNMQNYQSAGLTALLTLLNLRLGW